MELEETEEDEERPPSTEEVEAVSLHSKWLGANTSCSIEDNIASLKIHWLENQNRSTLENLDRRVRCLRDGGTTCGGSSTSSSHCFGSRSGNCQPLRWRNV